MEETTMANATYGTVRYIDNYTDAPKSAEYIVRRRLDDSVTLEHYSNGNCDVLHTFPFDAYWKDNFYDTLTKCREMIGCKKTIWVEVPSWLYLQRNSKSI